MRRPQQRRRGKPRATTLIAPPQPTLDNDSRDKVLKGKAFVRIKAFARVDEHDGLAEVYDSFVGSEGVYGLLGTNLVERTKILDDVKRPLRRQTRRDGFEMAIQFEPFQLASGSAPTIELKNAKDKAKVFSKTGLASVSAIVPIGYPDLNDPLRFGICIVVVTVFYGYSIRDTLEQARARSQSRHPDPALPKPTFEWLPPGRKAAVAEALEQLFIPRCYDWPGATEAALALGIEDWTKASFARKRAFQLFQAQTMMPLERLYFGYNDGEVLLKPLLSSAKLRLKSAKPRAPYVHRDGIVHFWCNELRRLDLGDLSVPLIKLR